MEKDAQNKILEFNALELQLNELEQQRAVVEKQLNELRILENALGQLEEIKPGKEMFTQLGQDIFLNSRLQDNKKVLINLGSKIFAKKSVEEAKESVVLKIKKFETLNEKIIEEIKSIIKVLMELEAEIKGQIK